MVNIKNYETLSESNWLNSSKYNAEGKINNPNGEAFFLDEYCKPRISFLFKKITQYGSSFLSRFFGSACDKSMSLTMDVIDFKDGDNVNIIKVTNLSIFGKPIIVENGDIFLMKTEFLCKNSVTASGYDPNYTLTDNGLNACKSSSSGKSFEERILSEEEIQTRNNWFLCGQPVCDDNNWNTGPVYTSYVYKYKKLVGFPILRFRKQNPNLKMKITIPAYGNTGEQIIEISKDNESFILNFNETNFSFQKFLSPILPIPKNLLLKMPEGFKDWLDFIFVNNSYISSYCSLSFFYKNKNNKDEQIIFNFKTKNGQSAPNGNWWSNEIKSLLSNKYYSRVSQIYLESIQNLNYFVKLHKDGRVLYNEETNHLSLTGIIEYQNPAERLLSGTNLLQPFYKEKQFSPQTYNFSKKVFLHLDDCPAVIVNSRDKKVIFSLNENNRIEIYFNDITTLTDATKMNLISNGQKREIKFENCNINLNLPMTSDKVMGGIITCKIGKACPETGLESIKMTHDFNCGFCTYRLKTNDSGFKVNDWKNRGWFDNNDGLEIKKDAAYTGSAQNDANNNVDFINQSMLRSLGVDGYQYINFIEFPNIVSIEFDAKDINKDLVITLPTYSEANSNFTRIKLDHDGFIISGFNLNRVEFNIEFDSKVLDLNTIVREIDQKDFMNDQYMNNLILEQENFSRFNRSENGQEYKFLNIVKYNPNEDLDGSIKSRLFNQNYSRFGIGTVALIAGLISLSITLVQKILEAAGVKLSENLKLALNIIQVALNFTLAFATLGSKPLSFLTKNPKFDDVVKDLSQFVRIAINIIQIPLIISDLPGAQIDSETGLSPTTIVNWKEGMKKHIFSSSNNLTEQEKNEIVENMISAAYTLASIGQKEIDRFVKDTTKDTSERMVMAYLQNILKYGAEYVYETAGGNLTIEEARAINLAFVKKASLSFLENLVDVYQG